MKLTEILEELCLEMEVERYSPRTIKTIKNNNLKFFEWCKIKHDISEIEDMNYNNIRGYILNLQALNRKPTYINSIIKTLRKFFNFAESEGYISENPMNKVKWAKEDRVIIKTFYDEDIKKIMNYYKSPNYLSVRNKTVVCFLIDTGIRCLELCNLKEDDIKEDYIRIFGKGKKERYVGITPLIKKQLLKYYRYKSKYFRVVKYDNVFLSNHGKPLTVEAVERIVKVAGKGIEGIRCSPHTFRHYFAQAQLRNGLDVYSVSRLLGHENISITQRYLQGIRDEDIIERSIMTSPLMNL